MAFPYSILNPNALPGSNNEFQPKDPEVPVVLDLGDPVIMSVWPYHELSRPVAVSNPWQDALDAPAISVADNGGADITNPDTEVGGTDHHLLKINKRGTFMQFRLVYDDGLTGITDPVIQAFGRDSSVDAWQRLGNLAGLIDITLVTAATDVTDATMNYTHADYQDQTIDLGACDEVLLGVKTNLQGTGVKNTAVVQAKLIGGIRSF